MNVNEAYTMLLTQEARIEQKAHMLFGMDVKHNLGANFAQNRGIKKGNMSGGRGSGSYNYYFGFDNAGNFGNDYKGVYRRYGFIENGPSNNIFGPNNQLRGYQGDNQRGVGTENWDSGAGSNNFNNRQAMNSKPQWNTFKPTCQIYFRTGYTSNIDQKLEEFINSDAYRLPLNWNPKAAYLADMDAPADTNQYIDSGATHRPTNDMQNMIVLEPFAGNSKLIIGNGTR